MLISSPAQFLGVLKPCVSLLLTFSTTMPLFVRPCLYVKPEFKRLITVIITWRENNEQHWKRETPTIQQYASFKYSRLPITRTFKGNRKKFELSGVRVIESSKKIAENSSYKWFASYFFSWLVFMWMLPVATAIQRGAPKIYACVLCVRVLCKTRRPFIRSFPRLS